MQSLTRLLVSVGPLITPYNHVTLFTKVGEEEMAVKNFCLENEKLFELSSSLLVWLLAFLFLSSTVFFDYLIFSSFLHNH